LEIIRLYSNSAKILEEYREAEQRARATSAKTRKYKTHLAKQEKYEVNQITKQLKDLKVAKNSYFGKYPTSTKSEIRAKNIVDSIRSDRTAQIQR
jgi:hypothetical protein